VWGGGKKERRKEEKICKGGPAALPYWAVLLLWMGKERGGGEREGVLCQGKRSAEQEGGGETEKKDKERFLRHLYTHHVRKRTCSLIPLGKKEGKGKRKGREEMGEASLSSIEVEWKKEKKKGGLPHTPPWCWTEERKRGKKKREKKRGFEITPPTQLLPFIRRYPTSPSAASEEKKGKGKEERKGGGER